MEAKIVAVATPTGIEARETKTVLAVKKTNPSKVVATKKTSEFLG